MWTSSHQTPPPPPPLEDDEIPSIKETRSKSSEFDLFDLDRRINELNVAFPALCNLFSLTAPDQPIISPTNMQDTVPCEPQTWSLTPTSDEEDDQARLRFPSGEFSPEVDFRDPDSVSVSSRVSSSPSSCRSYTHSTHSTYSSSAASEATTEESPLNAHLRNSRQAHSHMSKLAAFVEYQEEPETEEEDWDARDESESRRKRKRAPTTGRTLFRKKTQTKRNPSPKDVDEDDAGQRRRQRPKPPKREKKRRDWVNHPRAHEISHHIYSFLVSCRERREKPSAADIFHSYPEVFIDFGITESDKNKIGEHLRDIHRGRSTDPAGLLTKEVVWDLWYDQTRVSSTRRV